MTSDVAASIKALLLSQAREQGEEFERTLTRFTAERLLFRLGASPARDRCVLKGASLLAVWLPDPYRATRDVDLLVSGPADDVGVQALITAVCAVACPEDGLRFDVSELTIEPIRAVEEYGGKRLRFRAWLGKARIRVQVDLGFGDTLAAPAEEIEYPTLLARLPPPRLRAYPRESTVAEKFQAMVSLGTRNSRMKDFHDIWALAGSFGFKGPSLREAIAACFERRTTPLAADAPDALTQAFYRTPEAITRWRSYLTAGAVRSQPPGDFEVIGEQILRFLGPVWSSLVEGTSFSSSWPAGGPWKAES